MSREAEISYTPPISLSPFTLTDLAKIIERDSKDSTYKFALLRGTIEIIQNFPHYRKTDGKDISYPIGLMVLKWIEYYYPLLASKDFIPQKYGDDGQRTIAFRREFREVIALYKNATSYHELYSDLKKGMTDKARMAAVLKLLRKMRDTIKKQPMHYILTISSPFRHYTITISGTCYPVQMQSI